MLEKMTLNTQIDLTQAAVAEAGLLGVDVGSNWMAVVTWERKVKWLSGRRRGRIRVFIFLIYTPLYATLHFMYISL